MRHSSVMRPRQGTRPSLPVPHRHAASSPPSLLVLNHSHHICLLPCVAKIGKYLCLQIVCICEVCFWYVQMSLDNIWRVWTLHLPERPKSGSVWISSAEQCECAALMVRCSGGRSGMKSKLPEAAAARLKIQPINCHHNPSFSCMNWLFLIGINCYQNCDFPIRSTFKGKVLKNLWGGCNWRIFGVTKVGGMGPLSKTRRFAVSSTHPPSQGVTCLLHPMVIIHMSRA